MLSYVKLIKKIIEEKIQQAQDNRTLIICLDDVSHPHVYWEVASFFEKWARQRQKQYLARLSYEEFERFRQNHNPDYQVALDKMTAAGYVDQNNHMTYWRNKAVEGDCLALLMGTKAVEDQGGLADFFSVTHEYMDQVMKGDYAAWFNDLIMGHMEDSEKDTLNPIIHSIFHFSGRNLFRLSCIVDELAEKRLNYDVGSIISHLFERLYDDWGLPCVITCIPSIHQRREFSKLFYELARFRDRQDLRDLPPTRRKKLIDKIESSAIEWEPAQAPGYTSMNELKQDLIQYVLGERLNEVRPRILKTDYTLLRDILQLSTSRERDPIPEIPKFHGAPMQAFLGMIFWVLAEHHYKSIMFEVTSISLAGCRTDENDDENDNDLIRQWNRIRLMTGGLIAFLNSEFTATCDLELAWQDDRDPFSEAEVNRLLDKEILHRAAASQKLSRIEITLTASDEMTSLETEVIWEFSPTAPWMYTFMHVPQGLTDTYQNIYGSYYIPVVRIRRFIQLLTSNNEDEFFSELENAFVDYSENIIEDIWSKLPTTEAELRRRLGEVGICFSRFLTDLMSHGFYGTFITGCSISTLNLISSYCDFIEYVSSASLTSTAKAALTPFVNAFLLIDERNHTSQKELAGAVVLPVHPAMLEKMVEQAQFMRQGAKEIITDLYLKKEEKEKAVRQAEQRLKTFEQLSTISLSIDSLWAKGSVGHLGPEHTFGSFTIYRTNEIQPEGVSLNSVIIDDVASDEELPRKEVLRESSISDIIFTNLDTYLQTFPSQVDGLHVMFLNPPDLQPVVAGIHQLIESLKKQMNRSRVRIRLTVLAPIRALGSRSYLHYWLDNFFNDTDDVDITTYFKTVPFTARNIGSQIDQVLRSMPPTDVTFMQNIMDATQIQFEHAHHRPPQPTDTRFPMVFHPLPVFRTSMYRRTSISQLQFQASTAHTRLLYYLSAPLNPFIECQVVKQLQLRDEYEKVLQLVHNHSRWVVCIDPGIDRDIMTGRDRRIISFATGQGPFGELNVTVSALQESAVDVRIKLERRLRSLFGRWSDDTLQSVAERCLNIAEGLDGAHLLKALNPEDYQLHSFLSYILASQYLSIDSTDNETLIRSLIPLDSYDHWFRQKFNPTTGDLTRRPDFLLLEVKHTESNDEPLAVMATVIECKMGKFSEDYIEEGQNQLAQGLHALQTIWNPDSRSIDRRYWYSQLYRALVFSKVNMDDNDPTYTDFNNKLQGILDGRFSIAWKGLLLGYWLDFSTDGVEITKLLLDDCDGINAELHSFGQLAIQRMLVRDESEISFMPFGDTNAQYESEVNTSLFESTGQTESHRHLQYTQTQSAGQKPSLAAELIPPKAPTDITKSTDIRLLIGEDVRTGDPVYWEYGHPNLENRHILITGSSGSGKTYFIQALLLELSRQNISSVVFDYTDGFTPQKLEPEFVQAVGDRINQFPIYNQPFPLNPFKRYHVMVAGEFTPQNPIDVAERIKSSFTKVFALGDQQANAIYNAVKNGMDKYGENMSLAHFGDELYHISERNSSARTALSRLQHLIDRAPFDHKSSQDWSILARNPGSIFVVQLSGFTRDVQVAITQLILWDAWYYTVKHGDKSQPFPVVLDEAQNLDHSDTSPTAMILTEGRKFGWSGWFATQFLKGQVDQDELGRLQQASQKIFFKPPETELRDVALMINPDRANILELIGYLSRLKKGQCIVSGHTLRNGELIKDKPRIVQVTSLSARGGLQQ